jgi:hypothetical protein
MVNMVMHETMRPLRLDHWSWAAHNDDDFEIPFLQTVVYSVWDDG